MATAEPGKRQAAAANNFATSAHNAGSVRKDSATESAICDDASGPNRSRVSTAITSRMMSSRDRFRASPSLMRAAMRENSGRVTGVAFSAAPMEKPGAAGVAGAAASTFWGRPAGDVRRIGSMRINSVEGRPARRRTPPVFSDGGRGSLHESEPDDLASRNTANMIPIISLTGRGAGNIMVRRGRAAAVCRGPLFGVISESLKPNPGLTKEKAAAVGAAAQCI